jgi:hypothetical protein
MGLILPGERKSVEPMAARVDPGRVGAAHQSLHHFVAKADWSDEAMLAACEARCCRLSSGREPSAGLVSAGGNYYSVPCRTRRVVEVHQLPDQIRILDAGRLVAVHPILEGRRQYRVDAAHRQGGAAK